LSIELKIKINLKDNSRRLGVMKYNIKPIKNEADYKETLRIIDEILDNNPEEGSDLYFTLDALSTLVEKYEVTHYPIPEPDPIEYIKFIMEQRGLKQKDLEQYIGPKSRVSEIMNRKRYFTLEQIYKLSRGLGVPVDLFVNSKMLNMG
jgi:HTH-type transcriptional regulator / antitoxin HigA